MRIIFIDDSEQMTCPRADVGPLVAIGGVIVKSDQLAPVSEELQAIRSRYGVPADVELKWKPPKGSFLSTADGATVKAIRADMLDAALRCQLRTVVVIVNHGTAYTGLSKAALGKEILGWLYERVEMHLQDADDIGMVIADEPGGGAKAEKKWLTDSLQLTRNGTEFIKAKRIVLPIVTAPSHHLPHLQLADLVTSATTAAVAGHPPGLELVPRLKELAHTRRGGLIGGAGVVLWPSSLYDLHWWIFGETHYVKRNTGIPLGPNHTSEFVPPGRPFLTSDGLSPA